MIKKAKTKVITVKIEELEVCPHNPRKRDLDLESLKESIGKEGISEVVAVHRHKDKYHVMAGKRRLLSAKETGLKELVCLEYPFNEQQAKEWCRKNVLLQKDYHPLDIVDLVNSLITEYGSIPKASRATGLNESFFKRYSRIRNLDEELKEKLSSSPRTSIPSLETLGEIASLPKPKQMKAYGSIVGKTRKESKIILSKFRKKIIEREGTWIIGEKTKEQKLLPSLTKIEWTDYVCNVVTGCYGVNGIRCPYCYANRIANSLLKEKYLKNPNIVKNGDPNDPFTPRFWKNRLKEPLNLKKPSKIFIADMGELFGYWVPDEWVEAILDICNKTPRHTYQFLTKQPENMIKYNFPSNAWCGVTVTKEEDAHRIDTLLKGNSRIKFVSFEPLHGLVTHSLKGLDWIIIGEETKMKKKKVPCNSPKWEWVETLISNARELDIPIFLKPPLFKRYVNYKFKLQEFPK